MKTKSVPQSALALHGGKFELAEREGKEDKNKKMAPFRMLVRSADPIEHWFFGRTIHDLSGVTHRDRIAIDWMHDAEQLVGYANEFETDADGLWLAGMVTSTRDGDKASDIIEQSRAGIPFEASIAFPSRAPGDTAVEELDEGETAEVNGQTVTGPMTIFRTWPLSRAAICPSGADGNTKTQIEAAAAQPGATVEIGLIETNEHTQEDDAMKNEKTPVDAESTERLADAEQATDELDPTLAEGDGEAGDNGNGDNGAEAAQDSESNDREEFKRLVDHFGKEQAAEYFMQGIGFDEALRHDHARLKAELEAAKAKQSSGAGQKPAEFDPTESEGDVPLPKTYAEVERDCKVTGSDPKRVWAAWQASEKARLARVKK